MANEILAMERQPDGDYELVFLYPIPTPKQINATNVVPTPSSTLPALAVLALSAGEKSALDAGTAAFGVISFKRDPALTGGALLAKIQSLYTLRKNAFDADYALRYEFAGNRYDAA